MLFASFLAAALVVTSASPAPGQEPATRAEALRQAREAKQRQLHPYEPTPLERVMHLAEDHVLPVLQRDGLYAKFGALTTGSGTAFGAGWRDRSLVDGVGRMDLWAARSFTGYWALEGRVHYPLTPGDEVSVEGFARVYDYPREEFFGIGPDSARADRTIYTNRGTAFGVDVVARPVRHVSVGGSVGFLALDVDRGSGDLPSVHDRFAVPSVPGLAEQPDFLRTSVFAAYDYRQPLNARRGGLYRVDVARLDDRGGRAFAFTQTTVDLRQYVGFLAERRVLAARFWMSTTDAADGAAVPFYLMPALGGNDTLRGFRAFRFRGPHALLLQAEYRWEIWSALEAALFYDAGKVALRRSDLDLRDLEHDYGFGFRFNTDNGVVMRVDAAFGSRDGKHLHVVFGGTF